MLIAAGIIAGLSYSLGNSIRIHEHRIRTIEDTIEKHEHDIDQVNEDVLVLTDRLNDHIGKTEEHAHPDKKAHTQ